MPMTDVGDLPAMEVRRKGGEIIFDGADDDDDDRGGITGPNINARRGGVGRQRRAGAVVAAAAAAACCASASTSTASAVPSGTDNHRASSAPPRGAFGLPRRLIPPRDDGRPPAVTSDVVLGVIPRGGSVNDNAGGSAAAGEDDAPAPTSRRKGGGGRGKRGDDKERREKDKQKSNRRQRGGGGGPFRSRSRSRDGGGNGRSSTTGTTAPPAPSPPPQPQLQLPDDYYELLGVSRTSTPDEIQRAYRRMAVRTHPDKTDHGDRTHFDAISEAYDVLSDETKRSIYDRYGKRGLEANAAGGNPGGGSFFADDIFRSFFGGAPGSSGFGFSTMGSNGFFHRAQQQGQGQSSSPNRRQRTRSVRYQLEVTLEDLYRGSTRSVVIAKPEADDAPRRKRVDIDVERGMRHGSTVVLSGELDHVPDATPGDIVFVLAQTPHELFTRRNADLMCEVEVSPREALTGIRGTISHLDDRVVELLTDPDGPPVHDGEVRVLRGDGMPVRGRPGRFGDLYVRFKVKWPVTGYAGLTTEERAILGDLMDVAAAAAAAKSSNSSTAKPDEAEDAADVDVEGIRERLRERLAELLRRGGVGDEAAAAVAASAAAEVSSAAPNATTAAVTTGSANVTTSPDADTGEEVVAGAGAVADGEDEGAVGGRKRGRGGRDGGRRGRSSSPRYLQPALASDFGTSHPDEEGFDDRGGGGGGGRDHHHHHYDDDDDDDHFGFSYGRGPFGGVGGGNNNPFGQHFGFFSSSPGGPGYGDRGGRYYDDAGDAHRESNVQCQQM